MKMCDLPDYDLIDEDFGFETKEEPIRTKEEPRTNIDPPVRKNKNDQVVDLTEEVPSYLPSNLPIDLTGLDMPSLQMPSLQMPSLQIPFVAVPGPSGPSAPKTSVPKPPLKTANKKNSIFFQLTDNKIINVLYIKSVEIVTIAGNKYINIIYTDGTKEQRHFEESIAKFKFSRLSRMLLNLSYSK